MPFIDVKTSAVLSDAQKEALKAGLGKEISLLHKPESYLMVGICDGYDLYFAGKKLEKGAFVSVSLFGTPASADCEKMTQAICAMLKQTAGIEGKSVYVTYQGVKDWGFDGYHF